MVLSSTRREFSSTTTCKTVFLSFKSLLVLVNQLINALIEKVLGQNGFTKYESTDRNNNNISRIDHSDTGSKTVNQAHLKKLYDMPGPTSLPFFGTLLTSSALKSSDLMKANEEREHMYGPMVKEEHFWNYPLVMVLGTKEIKQILKENSMIRPGMEILDLYRSQRPDRYKSFGLVYSQGKIWKQLHNTFSTVATSIKFVRTLLPTHNDITSDWISDLGSEKLSSTGFPAALKNFIAEASFYNVFGKRMGFVGAAKKDTENFKLFCDCHDIYWNAFHKSMYGFPWWKYFPTNVWKDLTAAEDKMINTIAKITEELLADCSAGGILSQINKDKVPKEDIYVVLLELITGATEPVFHTVIITLYWISKHENVYNRVLEELREQLPSKDSFVDEAVLDNVPYLKACLTEAFRICPPACNLARILEKEIEVGGYRLPAYTTVIMQTWHACLQEKNFYRAKEYLPERWILEDGKPPFRPHERLLMGNFGTGKRSCPGRKIAQQLIHTFLCKVLRKFKVTFTEDIKVHYEWLMVVKEPVYFQLEEHDF